MGAPLLSLPPRCSCTHTPRMRSPGPGSAWGQSENENTGPLAAKVSRLSASCQPHPMPHRRVTFWLPPAWARGVLSHASCSSGPGIQPLFSLPPGHPFHPLPWVCFVHSHAVLPADLRLPMTQLSPTEPPPAGRHQPCWAQLLIKKGPLARGLLPRRWRALRARAGWSASAGCFVQLCFPG